MTNVYTDLLLSDGAIDLWMLDDASGTNAANLLAVRDRAPSRSTAG